MPSSLPDEDAWKTNNLDETIFILAAGRFLALGFFKNRNDMPGAVASFNLVTTVSFTAPVLPAPAVFLWY